MDIQDEGVGANGTHSSYSTGTSRSASLAAVVQPYGTNSGKGSSQPSEVDGPLHPLLATPQSFRFSPIWWRGVLSILLICCILCCSYVGFVVCMTIPLLRTQFAFSLTAIISYHTVFVLLVLSFLRSIFVDPGTVENTVTSESTFVDTSSASFCTLCQEVKPPRAHHCSKCKRCVTKMDHHCPWINNCVGWGNYKLFLLACTYCSLLGLVCFIFCLLRYIWIGISVHANAIAVVREIMIGGTCFGGFFFFVLLGLYVANHYYLACRNFSSIEYWQAKMTQGHPFDDCCSRWCPMVTGVGDFKSDYDIGTCRNLMQVFGTIPCLWCLPIANMEGNGMEFPRRLKP